MTADGEADFLRDSQSVTPQSKCENGKSAQLNRSHSLPACPECGSKRVWKDGIRQTGAGIVQRWICRLCGFRFSESAAQLKVKLNIACKRTEVLHSPMDLADQGISSTNLSSEEKTDSFSFSGCKDVTPHGPSELTTAEKCLNLFPLYNSNRRVCVSENEAKNLATVQPQTQEKAGAGATTTDTKNLLFNFAWWLKKEGYAETTITTRTKLLKILAKRGADLTDPESVKMAIARQEWCNKRKINAADAYTAFLRMIGGTWNPPRYLIARKLPFIPTETEIEQLIAGCSRKLTPLLQLLKETGIRIGEASRLKWTDVNLENGTIRVTPEKGSNPRIFQVSNKLRAMLTELQETETSDKVFPRSVRNQRRIFQRQRKKIAAKLHNPRIESITFHTFRHWKATMEYHKTKDILYVMKILGHKNINNTLIYTQLVDFKDDDYVSKVATTTEEACKLVEAGFEHVCEINGAHIFRKRK